MSMFPDTSLSLIRQMAVDATGERETAWVRFFELYTPAILKFAQRHASGQDPDDVLQDVLAKLCKVLRRNGYCPEKGSFRAYLATLIRNEIISVYRRERARGLGRNVSLDQIDDSWLDPMETPHAYDRALMVPASQAAELDLEWARVKHEAAQEQVLCKSAMSQKNKAVYVEHVIKGRPAKDVAEEFGITKNLVGQIKFKVNRAIEAIEREFAGGDA